MPENAVPTITVQQARETLERAGESRRRRSGRVSGNKRHLYCHPGDVPLLQGLGIDAQALQRSTPQVQRLLQVDHEALSRAGANVRAAIGSNTSQGLTWSSELGPLTRRRDEAAENPLPSTEGTTGLNASQGRVYAEYNSDLQSLADRMTRYEEMRRSEPAFAICENLTTIPLANTSYWFEPGDRQDPKSVRFAEFLNWNLTESLTRSFSETMREAALSIFYGFTWCYPRYEPKYFDGRIWTGWRQFAPRSRATVYKWDFADDGGLQGLVQYGKLPTTGETRYVYYGIEEILLWTWRGDNLDPEGLGAFRQAYKPYSYLEAFEEFAAIRIERTACGVPMATCAGGINTEDRDEVHAILQAIRTGEDLGIVVPDGWEIVMLDLGDADVPFGEHIERQHQKILQTVLAQFVALSQGGAEGSNALSKDASQTFFDNLNYGADFLCDVVNRYAVPRLWAMNLDAGTRQPRLMHGRVGVRDLERYTRAMQLPFKAGTEIPPEILGPWFEMMGVSPSEGMAALQKLMEERRDGGNRNGGNGGAATGTAATGGASDTARRRRAETA